MAKASGLQWRRRVHHERVTRRLRASSKCEEGYDGAGLAKKQGASSEPENGEGWHRAACQAEGKGAGLEGGPVACEEASIGEAGE